ncbi:binary toxin-like calcium binding domain-containing protein [Lactiplantibacillus plantarum]|uniref:binary toxin-like calcium binding domain-containing protein n=1 Tax=Lactiplantibacillus plantarum TaxID=1590 RepID=UPI002001B92E|nr:binary toxin-like calcium binding domain-containing protein [Lactiplantibacillus plantarum]
MNHSKLGLMGYYFKNTHFNNLVLFAPMKGDTLAYDDEAAQQLLISRDQVFHSIKWVGYLKSKVGGDFTFQLSNNMKADFIINGKVNETVKVKPNKLIPIQIRLQSEAGLKYSDIKHLTLLCYSQDGNVHAIQKDELIGPHAEEKINWLSIPKNKTVTVFDDEDTDTDNDAIPDKLEINGYTILEKLAVPWTPELGEKNYTKFVSNPYSSHTANDPYTDYEKASGDIDKASDNAARNPLVAAVPMVTVALEDVILSPKQDLSTSVSSHTSNNWSYSDTLGLGVDTGANALGPELKVTGNYSHTNTVGKEWGESKEASEHMNTAEAGYLNANVRYHNTGTGAIYDVKPTTNFVLDDKTIVTMSAQGNSTALLLGPKETYPSQGQHGIAITTMDDFGSHPITLNKQQLDTFLSGKTGLVLETTQTDGNFMRYNDYGNLVDGGPWKGYQLQIKSTSASIIIDSNTGAVERNIAAKDYSDPEDLTPEVTLKDALKMSFEDVTEDKNGDLYYNEHIPIRESMLLGILDEKTNKMINKQVKDTGKFADVKDLFSVKLEPHMNITFKLPLVYIDGEHKTPYDIFGTLVEHHSALSPTHDYKLPNLLRINVPDSYYKSNMGPGNYLMSFYYYSMPYASFRASYTIKDPRNGGHAIHTIERYKNDSNKVVRKKVVLSFKAPKSTERNPVSAIGMRFDESSAQAFTYIDNIALMKLNEKP